MTRRLSVLVALVFCWTAAVDAREDRDTKVRKDRKAFEDQDGWIYNDLPRGYAEAKKTGKPLLIVFR